MAKYNALEFGKELRYHRLQLGWSAQKLAELYSEFVGREDSPPTPQFIYRVETGETTLDLTRRAILASLVGMSLPFALHEERQLLIDIPEYTRSLEFYCQKWREGTLKQEAGAIQERTSQLALASFHACGEEKKTLFELFGFYQIMHADAWTGQEPARAHHILSSAVETARQGGTSLLRAHSLSQRAGIVLGRFETTKDPASIQAAVDDYASAAALANKLPSFYCGLLQMRKGLSDAYIARDKEAFTEALHLITKGSKQIGSASDDVRVVARLDYERYMLNRASAYLYAPQGNAKLALAELEELERWYPNPTGTSRQAHRNQLFAEAYLATGNYPMAVACLEAALESASGQALHRLTEVHTRLKNTSYWNTADIGRLAVKINQIRHPEFF